MNCMHGNDDRVMCRVHAQYYDPIQESGCPECGGENSDAAADPSAPPWGKLAFGLTMILVIGTFFLGTGPSGPPPDERTVPQMKAHPFKPVIKDLEYILYAAGSEGPSDAKEIVTLANRLADDMREWESRLSMTPYIVDVRQFGTFVQERARGGFDDVALSDARIEWERVRGEVFEPQAWFLTW